MESVSLLSSIDASNSSAIVDYTKPINFKELFVYKVFDVLNIGPKVHFAINKNLKKSIFIFTEDLTEGNKKFITMDAFDN